MPDFGRDAGPLYQLKKPLQGIFAVALLGAIPSGFYQDLARSRRAVSGQPEKPLPNLGRNRLRMAGIKAELNRRRHFVDVLAAGPRRADEIDVNFILNFH
jgi:hypothetical protein